MGALALALLSSACWGTGDFFGGLLTRRLGILFVGAVTQGAGLVITGALILLSGDPAPEGRYIAIGALGGVCGALGLGALYSGLAVGPMSIVAPVASLGVAVPVLVGFAQGERPAVAQIAGMALAIAGVVLASRETAADRDAIPSRIPGVVYGIVAAVLIGILITLLNAAGKQSATWAVFSIRMVSVPLFVIALVVARAWKVRPTRRDAGTLIGVGALDNVANVTFAFAGQTGLLSLVAVLGSLYPVMTVFLAWTVLHERLTRPQWIGVGMAFVGVALIAAG